MNIQRCDFQVQMLLQYTQTHEQVDALGLRISHIVAFKQLAKETTWNVTNFLTGRTWKNA